MSERLDLMYFGCAPLSAHAPELEIFILSLAFIPSAHFIFWCVCCWCSRWRFLHGHFWCVIPNTKVILCVCVVAAGAERRSWKMTSRNVNFQLLRGQRRAVECWCDEKRKTAAHLLPTRLCHNNTHTLTIQNDDTTNKYYRDAQCESNADRTHEILSAADKGSLLSHWFSDCDCLSSPWWIQKSMVHYLTLIKNILIRCNYATQSKRSKGRD